MKRIRSVAQLLLNAATVGALMYFTFPLRSFAKDLFRILRENAKTIAPEIDTLFYITSIILLVIAVLLILGFLIILFLAMRSRSRISRTPGDRLLSVADFLFSPATVEEVFKPTVADWHCEYFEALGRKKIWKARWISVRYNYRFLLAMGLSKILSAIRRRVSR